VRRGAPAGILAALALGGCGSQPLSGTELRGQAGRICQLAVAQTAGAPTPTAPPATAGFLRHGIAVLRPELRALRSLSPPSGVSGVYTGALRDVAAKVSALNDTVKDLGNGEDPVIAIKTLQSELAPLEARESTAWQTLGIAACLGA
jgi:hypothetical protein